jgi:DNA/RNA-binding domain of Phe-tRNA-synthetase-like protein
MHRRVQYGSMTTLSQFAVDAAVATIVRPAVLWWDGAQVSDHSEVLDRELPSAEARVRTMPPEETAAVRTMYKRIGLDPTRTRPSNEALLRRLRKGDRLPRINAMVDVINWCSVECQLPYGLYDRTRMHPPVTLRLGMAGEAYAGIRKDTVHVEGRLVVADDEGPFGNPTSDSARTMVTAVTADALVVVYAPVEVGQSRLAQVLDLTAERLRRVCGGHESGRWIA